MKCLLNTTTITRLKSSPLILKAMNLSPERQQIAKIFKKHIDNAITELGHGYEVTLQGKFDKTPIQIQIEITVKEGIP